MTTAITVDAHAGWDIEVQKVTLDNEGIISTTVVEVVPKFSKVTFYIHSHLMIGYIREVKGN